MWTFHTFRENSKMLSNAYDWYSNSPPFVKSISTFIEQREEFIQNLSGSLNFYGKIDGIPFGIVHGEEKTQEVVEGHLFCGNNVDIDFVSSLVTYSKNEALKHYKLVITSVLVKHSFLHEVMARSGFIDTGIRSVQAIYKNKMMEVVHYTSGEIK